MRIFLFGLFLRRISLMESWPKFVRLVLLIFGFILFYQFYQFYVSLGDNWCCLVYFTFSLLICSCMPMLTIQFSIHTYDSDYRYTYACLYTLSIRIATRWVTFWLPWTFMFRSQSLDIRGSFCWGLSLHCEAGRPAVAPVSSFVSPGWLVASPCNSWETFVMFIL